MAKFKVGDRVRRVHHNWGGIKVGMEGTVTYCGHSGLWLKEFPNDGGADSSLFTLVEVNPLEEAKALLEKEGYTITPPKPKLSGELILWYFNGHRGDKPLVSHVKHFVDSSDKTVVARLSWTEGDGLNIPLVGDADSMV